MAQFPWWTPEVDDLIVRAKAVAQADPDFARRVFEDTNGAIKERFGFDVPQKVQLFMVDDHTLGLRPLGPPEPAGDELSDAELDLVSAGASGACDGPKEDSGGFSS